MESLCNINGHVVDAILHGMLAERRKQFFHLPAVGIGDLMGLQLHLTAALQIDEEVGASVVVEVDFMGEVIGMEDDNFVFVVAQVAQSIEEVFLLILPYEGICEKNHKGALVELLCGEVDGFGYGGFAERPFVGSNGLQQFVEQAEKIMLMDAAGAAGGKLVELITEEREPESIALTV